MRLFSESGWRFWWIALLVLVADQLTKVWVLQNFTLGESVQLLPVFNFTYARQLRRWPFRFLVTLAAGNAGCLRRSQLW